MTTRKDALTNVSSLSLSLVLTFVFSLHTSQDLSFNVYYDAVAENV